MAKETILLVDDEVETLVAVRKVLEKRGGFEVLVAESAEKALDLLGNADISLVITDIRMPGMDGMSLLKNIKASRPDLPIIITTGYGSVETAVEALKDGADDYLTKPTNPAEIVHKIRESLGRAREKVAEREQIKRMTDRTAYLSDEISRAKDVQASFIPNFYEDERIRVDTFFKPASDLAGDFYDIIPIGGSKTALIIGDVAGHGISSSLHMAMIHRLVKKEILTSHDPAGSLTSLNKFLYEETGLNYIFSLVVALVDFKSLKMTFTNGGHPPPFATRGKGERRLISSDDPYLLVVPDYVYRNRSLSLAPGDTLVFYTDGMSDTRDKDGRFFGEDRIYAAVEERLGEPPSDIVANLAARLAEFKGDDHYVDDVSLMVAAVKKPAR